MIITRTPLRISFVGGGTDMAAFYASEAGAVVSCTIDKYIFVILKRRFDARIRVGYTRTELVDRAEELEHDLVRESLRLTATEPGIEVTTMGDIPSRGSGLGSSSTVTVGLLHALWLLQGQRPGKTTLAEGACEIEIDRLARPIGKQDQYAAAFGGLRYYEFAPEGVWPGEPIGSDETLRTLGSRLMLFFTGTTRKSSVVLYEQRRNVEGARSTLRAMADLAVHARDALAAGNIDALGEMLDEGWQRKRTLASRVTNAQIDDMYAAAKAAGATGGKICGAGGGGFLLVFCHPDRQPAVREALAGYRELEFALAPTGSEVVAEDLGEERGQSNGAHAAARITTGGNPTPRWPRP